jgi:hypothetical protein
VRRLAVLLPASVCALAAHALVLGTHGYFVWYEPFVEGAAVAALALLGLAALAGRRLPLPAPEPRLLVATTFAFLFVQESIEQHRLVALTPSQLLLMLAAVAVTSLVVALALRVVTAALAPVAARVVRVERPGWTIVLARTRSVRPLASACTRRGPPLLAA